MTIFTCTLHGGYSVLSIYSNIGGPPTCTVRMIYSIYVMTCMYNRILLAAMQWVGLVLAIDLVYVYLHDCAWIGWNASTCLEKWNVQNNNCVEQLIKDKIK